MKPITKAIVAVVGVATLLYAGLVAYAVATAPVQLLVVYATRGGSYFPAVLPRLYFLHSGAAAEEIKGASASIIPFTLNGVYRYQSSERHRM